MKNAIALFSVISLLLLAASCKDDDPVTQTEEKTEFDRAPMLKNIGENIIVPAYEELNTAVQSLDNATATFASNPTQTNLDNLRSSWLTALEKWQYVSYYQFGPADAVLLRDNVNLYPIDTATLESNISNGGYDLATTSNFDAKGFQALDYLLYGIGNTDTEILSKYTTDAQASSRLTYLNDIVDDMTTLINTVNIDWKPSGGNYLSTFKNQTGLSIGGSTNLLYNAFLMHFEKFVRSGKVGIPAGALSFSQTPLPDRVECYYSGNSKIQMQFAMEGLYNLYNGIGASGNNGEGFKEYLAYLETAGNSSSGLLADQINDQMAAIDNVVSSNIIEPFSDHVANNQTTVLDVFDEMQTLVVLLKNDMKTAIGLTVTYVDTDGD